MRKARWIATAATSSRMRCVPSVGTRPELRVARALQRLGYSYQSHVAGVPGKPDFVLARRRKVIFVHGCFWHRHGKRCRLCTTPTRNVELWTDKFTRTKARDRNARRRLRALRFDVLVVWECQLRTWNAAALQRKLAAFVRET
jgi:DNA mismatch endonuclease (patch repair protein)